MSKSKRNKAGRKKTSVRRARNAAPRSAVASLDAARPNSDVARTFFAATRETTFQALSDAAGNVRYPKDGDRLEFERDGRRYCYRVAASSESSRRWDWRFKRPGARIVFYATRDAPKEERFARY